MKSSPILESSSKVVFAQCCPEYIIGKRLSNTLNRHKVELYFHDENEASITCEALREFYATSSTEDNDAIGGPPTLHSDRYSGITTLYSVQIETSEKEWNSITSQTAEGCSSSSLFLALQRVNPKVESCYLFAIKKYSEYDNVSDIPPDQPRNSFLGSQCTTENGNNHNIAMKFATQAAALLYQTQLQGNGSAIPSQITRECDLDGPRRYLLSLTYTPSRQQSQIVNPNNTLASDSANNEKHDASPLAAPAPESRVSNATTTKACASNLTTYAVDDVIGAIKKFTRKEQDKIAQALDISRHTRSNGDVTVDVICATLDNLGISNAISTTLSVISELNNQQQQSMTHRR